MAYYDFCESNHTHWWEISYLLLFGVLQLHKAHRKDVMFLECCTPNSSINPPELIIPVSVKSIVTVVLCRSHYSVLEFILEEKKVKVYDGLLKYNISLWTNHICYIMKQIGENYDDWESGHVDKFLLRSIIQVDSFNCGPMACMVMWGLFNPCTEFQEAWKSSNSVASFRKSVVNETKICLDSFCNDFLVRMRSDLFTIDDDELIPKASDNDASADDCPICLTPAIITANDVTSLPQCRHLFHDNCIIEWNKHSLCCPLCKKVPNGNGLTEEYCQLTSILRKREDADKKRKNVQTKQGEKMKRLSGACVKVDVGDLVRIHIPDVDKAPCRSMDVMGVVLQVNDTTKTIRVATRHGLIGRGGKGSKCHGLIGRGEKGSKISYLLLQHTKGNMVH